MLSALRDDPRFGYRTPELMAAEEAKIMAAIGYTPSATPVRYGLRDYFEYYKATLGPSMVRSFAGATAGIILLLGGWLTTVHAASNSLPGDPLYGFKLITEQVQLRMASLEQRAVLHTEFAERRLHEAVTLQENGATDADDVRVAFDGFKREVSSANSDLQMLQQAGSADAVETAGKIEQKLASLDAVLDQTVGTDATIVAQEAKDISREAQTTAVAVVVDTHESGDTVAPTVEMQQMFMRQFGDLEARQSFDLHRLEVIYNAVTSDDPRLADIALPSTVELGLVEKILLGEETRLADALTGYNSGDYRAAFDMLQSIDGELQQEEYRMAQTEIAITQSFTQPPDVTPTDPPTTSQ